MRTGGFPCRFPGCEVRFAVPESDSMPALLAASGRRTEHEISAHNYRHVRIPDEPRPRSTFNARPKGAPKGG
jgi:hypothetical protein